MILYLIPFIVLSILTSIENSTRFTSFISNKYLYYLIALFFIIFIGLRYEVGCDWQQYKEMFEKFNSLNLLEIIERNFFAKQKLQEIGHIILTLVSQNIYVLNFIYSIIFSLPLFYFCSQLKRKYFTLLISYPYYIIVIGMGPIRQAACISLFMLSILLVSKKKYYSHFFLTVTSALLHQSSILFNSIIFGSLLNQFKKIKFSKKNILIIFLLSLIFLYCLPSITQKFIFYINIYDFRDQNGVRLINPAKSAIYIWFLHFITSIIFIKNISKFDFNNSLNRILILLSIFDFLLLPIIFLNSVIAYRFLLYLFPSSILITSKVPDLKLFNINKNYYINIIIGLSLLSLIIWLNFAFHSSCWVPYKNILFFKIS